MTDDVVLLRDCFFYAALGNLSWNPQAGLVELVRSPVGSWCWGSFAFRIESTTTPCWGRVVSNCKAGGEKRIPGIPLGFTEWLCCTLIWCLSSSFVIFSFPFLSSSRSCLMLEGTLKGAAPLFLLQFSVLANALSPSQAGQEFFNLLPLWLQTLPLLLLHPPPLLLKLVPPFH